MDEELSAGALGANFRQANRPGSPAFSDQTTTQTKPIQNAPIETPMPTGNSLVVPVIRDTGFTNLRPDRLNIIRIASNQTDKYELRLQSFVCSETSQRINLTPGGDLDVMSRDIRMEVRELATVDLTLPQIRKLRDDLTREIYIAQGSPAGLAMPPNPGQSMGPLPESLAYQTASQTGRQTTGHTAPVDVTPDASWEEPGSDAPLPDEAPLDSSADTMETVYPHPLFDDLDPEPFPEQRKRFRRFGLAADVGFCMVLGALALLFYYVDPLTLRERLSAWQDGTPPAAEIQAEGVTTKQPDTETTAAVAPAPAPVPSTPPPPAPEPGAAPPLPHQAPPPAPLAAATPAASATPEVTPVATPPAPPVPVPHLAITVRSSCWIIVSDYKGKVYIERLMRAGETWTVPPVQGLELRAGNAGATSLVVDGETKPPLGANNALWTGPLSS